MRRAHIAPALLLVATAVVVAVVLRGDGRDRTLRAAFTDANNIVKGLDVRMAGTRVGRVTAVRTDAGGALVGMKITDASVWPLRAGTTARIRFGPTAGYAARYVELVPGRATAPPLPPHALLALDATQAPVEFDDVVRTFDAAGRRSLRGLLATSDQTLAGTGPQIGAALGSTGPALSTLAGVLAQLGDRPGALPGWWTARRARA